MTWKQRTYILLSFCVLAVSVFLTGCKSSASETERIPKIDFHAHYNYDRGYLSSVLDKWNMHAVSINVVRKPGSGRQAWRAMLNLHEQYPERIFLCTAFDPFRINEPNFAEEAIDQLKRDIGAGALMVKVWKVVGMEVRDQKGDYVQIDDPRFQPIWDFLAKEDIPVLAHIGEPRAAWQPLDPESPHYGYYKDHPEYHAYKHPEIPSWETIMAARDHWLENNPDLTVIGAHLGSMAYDVEEVAKRLDAYPNFYVDTAARFGDLFNQSSEKVRSFFLKYQDRIIYGTDLGIAVPEDSVSEATTESEQARMKEMLSRHWRYLTGRDSLYSDSPTASLDTTMQSLNLPLEAVEKVYYGNAARVLDIE